MQRPNISNKIMYTATSFSFRDSSLLVKQIISFLIITLIPISAINYIWFKTTTGIIQEHSIQSTTQIFRQVNENIKNSLEEINNLSLSILFDKELNDALNNAPDNILVKIRLQNTLSEKLMSLESTSKKISAISILSENINVSSTTTQTLYEKLKSQDWYQSFVNKNEKKMYTKVHRDDYFSDMNKGKALVFSFLRNITSIENGTQIGVLVIDIKYKVIEQIFTELQVKDKSTFVVYDAEGNLVYHPVFDTMFENSEKIKDLFNLLTESKGVLNTVFEGEHSLIQYDTLPYTNWKIVNVVPIRTLMGKSLEIRRITTILQILFILLVIIVALFLSLYISKPITRLVKTMKLVEAGDLDIRVDINSRDEVGQLGRSFNQMLEEISNLIHKVYHEQEKKREIELKALQSQINPHFLYNTLNTIRWMAVIQKADNINKMIVALIKLLEFSGKKSSEFVSVEEELNHVNHYIYLQKIRYGDKFKVEYDIDEQLLQYKTIKFILQPIVENAIFHGIEPKNGIGVIKIVLTQLNDKLKFEIIDDGVGMDIEVDKKRKFSGLGIENVNERLIRSFGVDSRLHIDSKAGQGTSVGFYLPMITDEGVRIENAYSNDC